MGQKRRRLALSCVACRRRKVKCDRTSPTCNRCQKGEIDCNYVPYTAKENVALPTPTDDSPRVQREASVHSRTQYASDWQDHARQHRASTRNLDEGDTHGDGQPRPTTKTLQDLIERVSDLETYIKGNRSRPLLTDSHLGATHLHRAGMSTEMGPSGDGERALLRGEGFKTQYFGPSHAASLLLHYEELSRFVKDILLRLPTLQRAREAFKRKRKENKPMLMLPDYKNLMSLLPDRQATEIRVQEYFEILEHTYRVLHAPTFFRQYKQFWDGSGDMPPVFLVQLLLVCASVHATVPGEPTAYVGPSSVARDTASKWIEVCEWWLDLQSQKHMTLEVFQVQVLLVLAKRLNCIKVKREWTAAGHLLRLAMSIGLHREPTLLAQKTSVFTLEMRRRLWCTILELDVSASFDRGLTPSIGPLDWDTLPPSNVHDEDFDQETETMPAPRPIAEFTRTSFLCLAHQHVALRLEILSRVNSIRASLDGEMALELDRLIRKALVALPSWSDGPIMAMVKDLSDLLLYEVLVLIHQPFTTSADARAHHFSYSGAGRQHAAFATLQKYAKFRPGLAFTLTNIRVDLFRATLALCHGVMMAEGSRPKSLVVDKVAAIELIEKSVDLMEDRIRLFGQGFHSYWLTFSALTLLQSKLNLDNAPVDVAQKAADRVAKLHAHMMERQVMEIDNLIPNDVSEISMSTANTLVGMSAQPLTAPDLSDLGPFTPMGEQFNVFSDTLFDFDMADLWGYGMNQRQ